MLPRVLPFAAGEPLHRDGKCVDGSTVGWSSCVASTFLGVGGVKRVAVLADVHGNLHALEAVLAEPDVASADLIVFNGDLADGPFPRETMERIEALGPKGVWLRGNGDRWIVEARAGRFRHPDPSTDALIHWAAGRLSEAQVARLAALPMRTTVDIENGRVALCHATARSDNEMLLVDSTIGQARAAFQGIDAGLVVVGHSHMPFDRLFDRRRVVNAGSVGLPYGHSGASWALLGPDPVLRRTSYDARAAADAIVASGMPGALDFAETCILTVESDAAALDAFRTTLERQQRDADFG